MDLKQSSYLQKYPSIIITFLYTGLIHFPHSNRRSVHKLFLSFKNIFPLILIWILDILVQWFRLYLLYIYDYLFHHQIQNHLMSCRSLFSFYLSAFKGFLGQNVENQHFPNCTPGASTFCSYMPLRSLNYSQQGNGASLALNAIFLTCLCL